MPPPSSDASGATHLRKFTLVGLLLAFTPACAMLALFLKVQPAGIDFSPMWAGGRTALDDTARLYDFQHITALQGWPKQGDLRPFIYPPSSLLLFAPLALLPYWTAYATWMATTGGLYLWAGRRIGAPWWLLVFPIFWLVVYCGQSTFLIGGLVMAALTLPRRPLVAGVLLGLAAAIKPQMLLFLPLALLAEGRWKTIVAAGLAGLAMCLATLPVWGLSPWFEWIGAMGRFKDEVLFANPGLVEDMITPYALLSRLGVAGAWAWLLAPLTALGVWATFRTSQNPADRTIAVFAAAILVSPYAMHYEAALLAPGVAAYMARLDARRWPLYAGVAVVFAIGPAMAPVAAAAVLPLSALIARRAAPTAPGYSAA